MPSDRQIRHSISSLAAPLRYIDSHALNLDQCLIGTGISKPTLRDSSSRIHLDQLLQFCRNIRELSDDRYLGLALGSELHVAGYGMFGFAMLSAKTLRQAVQLGMRLVTLSFTGFKHELIEQGGTATHRMAPLMDYGDLLNVMSDREVSAVHLIYQELMRGSLPVIEINFVHHGGEFPSCYARHFDCPVNFGRPFNEIVIPIDVLDRTVSDASKESRELCIQQCELLISQLSKQSNLVDDVRYAILSQPGYFPDIDTIAEKMHMSSRTLRRHLSAQNTNFQKLVNEIRFGLARDYLLTTNFRLDQIAELLGYSEPGNFTHAFKRWAGVSPRTYRMQNY
jgi:AraC-like DNA-binding protein